jgi:prepilin-type processing-associated H-X9-DG protein
MKVLQCPDDNTVQIGQGNLSYVVNGGFTLFHAIPAGWNPAANGTAGTDGAGGPVAMQWGVALSTTPQWVADMANTSKLGVFFPESTMPQGNPTRIPWNVRSSIAGIPDGASATLMLSENTLAGVGGIPPYAQTVLGETNWACPLPQFATFIGSSSVCGALTSSPVNCTNNSMLQPTGDNDSQFWAFANRVGTFANINGARTLTLEGSYPFSNSGHPAGCNMGFCDGAVRFISNTIDGTVYAKIITPSGSKLPTYLKQMPVEQDAFVN